MKQHFLGHFSLSNQKQLLQALTWPVGGQENKEASILVIVITSVSSKTLCKMTENYLLLGPI